MQDYTKTTLGELLSSENETIRRNAVSILKILQDDKWHCLECGEIKLEYEAGLCEKCFHRLNNQ